MANNNQPAQQREGMGGYLKGVRKEMGKVIWPTRQELAAYTGVVLATCAASGIAFWLIDLGVLTALKQLLGITLN